MLRVCLVGLCLVAVSLQLNCYVGESADLAEVDCATVYGVEQGYCAKYEL